MNWYSLATFELAGRQQPGLVVENTLYALADVGQACGIEASRLPQDLNVALADWSRHAPLLADAAVYRPSPSEEDLVLLAGGEAGLEADVVELGWAGDPRRGSGPGEGGARQPDAGG